MRRGAFRAAAFELLSKRGDSRLLRELEELLDTPEGTEATLVVRARHAPVAALRELLKQPSLHSKDVEEALLTNAQKLPASSLRHGLSSDYADIRRLSIRALDRSSRVRKDDVLAVMTSELPPQERMEALSIALRRKWTLQEGVLESAIKDAGPFGEAENLQVKFHSQRTSEDLLQDLKWIGGSSWVQYEALGLAHFDVFGDRIREDLESDFKVLRDAYRQNVEAAIRASASERLRKLSKADRPNPVLVDSLVAEEMKDFFKDFDSLDTFTLRRFQLAALRALVAHGDVSDVVYARRLIEAGDKELTNECVRLLECFGTAEDAPILSHAAESLYFDDSIRAAEAALAVSGNSLDTISRLIKMEKPRLSTVAISALKSVPIEEAIDQLLPLLRSKDASVRRASVDCLAQRFTRVQQRKLIDLYSQGGGYYYYNVIVRLDRRLYAPSWVRAALQAL